MAEARSIVGIGANIREGGAKLKLDDDGAHFSFSFTVPLKKEVIKRRVRTRCRHIRNIISHETYPLGPVALVAVMACVTLWVGYVDRDHWIRQGWLGNTVWYIGMSFPLVHLIPRYLRVLWFTLWAAVVGFWLLVAAQRLLLRTLFSYQRFLYSSRGKKTPITVKIWAVLVKLLTRRQTMTYGYDGSLPSLPLPSTKDTCQRWLASMKPVQSPEEYAKSEALVAKFLVEEGPRLQKYLRLQHLISKNYVAEWWEKYCYHKGRSSIMINSNYYVLDGAFTCPTTVRNARIAQMLHNMLKYNRQVENEQIEPMLIGNLAPLDMGQHRRMFSTTRIPGRDCDSLRHVAYQDTRHIVVLYKGYWFKLDVLRSLQRRVVAAHELEELLDFIVAEVNELPPVDEAEGSIAALTAGNRTKWAEAREMYFADGINRASLHTIETAILVLVLEDESPSDFTDQGHRLIHGNGANIWFDKSLTLVGFGNGRLGFNVEHSWADAPVIAHMMEHCCMTGEMVAGTYAEDGHTKPTAPSGPTPPRRPARIVFDLPRACRQSIQTALTTAKEAIADFDLKFLSFEGYGKGFMKKLKVSPDAYIQMALHTTYYKLIGRFDQTYESAMTRLFNQGRTETIRPISERSTAFVRAFLDDSVPAEESHKLMQAASEYHVKLSLDAMTGKGCDRHLFGLYIVSVGKNIESPFLKKALGEPWRLSTSQQPQQQTKRWNTRNPEDCKRLCAGGGFGPVADDGYGVSYMVAGENTVFFHISSKISCAGTDSSQFAATLAETLTNMKSKYASVAQTSKSGNKKND